jgi:hypothetical protein
MKRFSMTCGMVEEQIYGLTYMENVLGAIIFLSVYYVLCWFEMHEKTGS